MGNRELDTFAGRSDVVLDFGGRTYCWPCLKGTGAAVDGLRVTGQRLGNEPCHECGRIGAIVLEVSGPARP